MALLRLYLSYGSTGRVTNSLKGGFNSMLFIEYNVELVLSKE